MTLSEKGSVESIQRRQRSERTFCTQTGMSKDGDYQGLERWLVSQGGVEKGRNENMEGVM